ncbi:MAG: DUF2750 domain-containing protein [Parcubacteria group bacterium]|nr:DUF2750 domain-containing protein [Parcubacteria group bacterium]
MSQSSSQSIKFYKDVALNKKVWTIKDSKGFPAPKTFDGKRAMPFWSRLEMVEKIIQTVPAYRGFSPHELSWNEFVSKWVPGMTKDGLLAGLNWGGEKATGYDYEPEEVKKNIETIMGSGLIQP